MVLRAEVGATKMGKCGRDAGVEVLVFGWNRGLEAGAGAAVAAAE